MDQLLTIKKIDLKSFNLSEIEINFSGVIELIRIFKITCLLKKIGSKNLFIKLYKKALIEFNRNYDDFFILYNIYCTDNFEYKLYTLSVLLKLPYYMVFDYYYNLLKSYIGIYLQQSFNFSYSSYLKRGDDCLLKIYNDNIVTINHFQKKIILIIHWTKSIIY